MYSTKVLVVSTGCDGEMPLSANKDGRRDAAIVG